jgi:hypothetical protein
VKKSLYQKAGVQEYVAVLIKEQEIRWHRLVNGAFQMLRPTAKGLYRSEMFPGLWLDGPALLNGDLTRVLRTLGRGQNVRHISQSHIGVDYPGGTRISIREPNQEKTRNCCPVSRALLHQLMEATVGLVYTPARTASSVSEHLNRRRWQTTPCIPFFRDAGAAC